MSQIERGVYEPPYDEEDPDTFDATDEEEEEGRGRSPIILILALLVLLGFAAVVWMAYDQGVRQANRGEPPVLAAEEGPVRVAPEAPGGQQILHQDKVIYDQVAGETAPTGEQLLPPAETPKPIPAPVTAAPPTATPTTDFPISGTTAGKPPAAATSPATLPPVATPVPEKPVVASPKPAPAEAEKPPAAVAAAPVKPPVTEPTKPAAPAAATPAPTTATPVSGWMVQVGAFDQDSLAADAWSRVKSNYGDLLTGLKPDVQTADLGAKGIWYRLRIGPFESKEAAAQLCSQLKARGQDCLVAKP